MDYIVASLMRHHNPLLPVFFLLNLVFNLVRFIIPKLHIYGHKLLCQLLYSLNYTLGAARTDREGIERPWANVGPVATSTREMGPGGCQDTLNDHWGHWNWIKLIGLGALLKKGLLRAIPERNFQHDSLATFTEHQAEHVGGWKAMVEVFEADNTKLHPYELPKSGINENDVRMELAKEEAVEQEGGLLPIHNVSPSVFILAGLDIEEQQHVAVALNKNESSKHSVEIIEKCTKLSRYTTRFRKIQAVYMPDRPAPRGEKEEEAASLVENSVDEIEVHLRNAQCCSSLDRVCSYLHVKSRFRTYNGSQVQHQGATTHARNLMNRNDEKIRVQAEKYVAAWEAKCTLVGEDKVGWHRLNPKKDLRCMDSEEDRAIGNHRKKRGKGRKRGVGEAATEEDRMEGVGEGQQRKNPMGEGTRTISWIWVGADADEQIVDDEEEGSVGVALDDGEDE
ncbi:hypothetical protein B0H13DRAFT_1874455 [Mycena leptocephala]|nr:hypothetical protein B0H13DRAFT_1874455 [Mycena leptocephala]